MSSVFVGWHFTLRAQEPSHVKDLHQPPHPRSIAFNLKQTSDIYTKCFLNSGGWGMPRNIHKHISILFHVSTCLTICVLYKNMWFTKTWWNKCIHENTFSHCKKVKFRISSHLIVIVYKICLYLKMLHKRNNHWPINIEFVIDYCSLCQLF